MSSIILKILRFMILKYIKMDEWLTGLTIKKIQTAEDFDKSRATVIVFDHL